MVHAGLHRFLEEAARGWPADARERLRAHWLRALAEAGLRTALAELVGAAAGAHRRLGRRDGDGAAQSGWRPPPCPPR